MFVLKLLQLKYRMISSPMKEPKSQKKCVFLLKPGQFKLKKPVPDNLWGPVAVPPNVAKSCANVAIHGLVNFAYSTHLSTSEHCCKVLQAQTWD